MYFRPSKNMSDSRVKYRSFLLMLAQCVLAFHGGNYFNSTSICRYTSFSLPNVLLLKSLLHLLLPLLPSLPSDSVK